jgi:thymidylate kinase
MRTRLENRRPRFVSFSGIDGAGKSTQIENLCARLKEAGLRVELIIFWNDIARLTRIREAAGHTLFKGDHGVGSPARPINRRDKNVQSGILSPIRLFLYFVDTLSLRFVAVKASKLHTDFVIFDRYIYDQLANLPLRHPAAKLYARLIMKLAPKPDISYLLDADPVQARARKPEYPIEFLHSNRASYLALNDAVGAMTIIAPMPVQDVQRQVWKHLVKLLSPAEMKSEPAETLVPNGDPGIPARSEERNAFPAAL